MRIAWGIVAALLQYLTLFNFFEQFAFLLSLLHVHSDKVYLWFCLCRCYCWYFHQSRKCAQHFELRDFESLSQRFKMRTMTVSYFPYHIVPYCIVSHRIVSHCIVSYWPVSYQHILYCIALSCVISYHPELFFIVLHCITSCTAIGLHCFVWHQAVQPVLYCVAGEWDFSVIRLASIQSHLKRVSPVWDVPAPPAACWGPAPDCPDPCAGPRSPFSAGRRAPTAWPPLQPDWRAAPGPVPSPTSSPSRGRSASGAATSARPPAAGSCCCSRGSWGRWRCWCASRRRAPPSPARWPRPGWWRCGAGRRTWAGPGSGSWRGWCRWRWRPVARPRRAGWCRAGSCSSSSGQSGGMEGWDREVRRL